MFGFVTRRRYETDLTAAKAETNRQRRLRTAAEEREKTAVINRKQILVQNAKLDAANRRLAAQNRALAEQLKRAQASSGFDHAKAQATADRIAELTAEVARARRQVAALQKQVDEATGMDGDKIHDTGRWQPGYKKPTPDAGVSAS